MTKPDRVHSSLWPHIASNGTAHLTRTEIARMVAKGLSSPSISPSLRQKLDIIGRYKIREADQADRHEGFRQLRKKWARVARAELGSDYFIEGKAMERAKRPDLYEANETRRENAANLG